MNEKLVLEGDFEYGTYDFESPYEKVGGVDLISAIAEFLGSPDSDSGCAYRGTGWCKTTYKNVRITIERIANADI